MSSPTTRKRLSAKRRRQEKRRRSAEHAAQGQRDQTAQERAERRKRAEEDEAAYMRRVRWHMVDARTGQGQKLNEALASNAVPALRLSTEVVQVRHGRTIRTRMPLLGRMVFVGLDAETPEDLKRLHPEIEQVRFRDEKYLTVPGKELDRFAGTLRGDLKPAKSNQASANRAEDFELGEEVRVVDGPFASFSAVIEEIDSESQHLKVSVNIFGRGTPVALEVGQVERSRNAA
jgi:transcription termination/antitermination protein NusG